MERMEDKAFGDLSGLLSLVPFFLFGFSFFGGFYAIAGLVFVFLIISSFFFEA
jgi:hypothetical protein